MGRDSQPRVLHRQRYKPWHRLRHDGELGEIILKPGSFLSDQKIKDEWVHGYYPESAERPMQTITDNTIFWYEPGEYKLYKPTHPLQAEMAGIFLKDVLSREAQDQALVGLEQLDWDHHPPKKRPETLTAIERQKGLVPPGEYTYGWTFFSGLLERASRRIEPQFNHLEKLLREMDDCFARTLPLYHRDANVSKSPEEREAESKRPKQPEYGGILPKFRQFFTTTFSTITLLRSCPASIHLDRNARNDQTSFTCLTSVGRRNEKGEVEFSGGTFCLIEYGIKIPVTPGSILIAQTTREWHYNTTPVQGTKYSIVCYYRKQLGNPKLKPGKSVFMPKA